MLKYLFTAEFKDGELFDQNEEDVSSIDPKRSSFFDVLQRENELVRFHLYSEKENKLFTVDLRDGSFAVNGILFKLHDEPFLKDFRLIFFRKHRHTFTTDLEEKSHDIVYRLGWQCTVDDKNYQHVMEIK